MDPKYEPEWTDYLKQFDLPLSTFQLITKDTNKFCVIVEPRRHPLLSLVIKNFMYLLQPRGYGLIIFHGTENKDLVTGYNAHYFSLGKSNLTIAEYNTLLKSREFWQKLIGIGCEHALIFQTDVVLLNDNVDEFLKYDYIGAPWSMRWFGLEVGNGGFSLRNARVMLEIIEKYPDLIPGENEDIFFSLACLKYGYKIPSYDEAKKFSVETDYYDDPVGVHKPYLEHFPSRDAYVKLLSKR